MDCGYALCSAGAAGDAPLADEMWQQDLHTLAQQQSAVAYFQRGAASEASQQRQGATSLTAGVAVP